MCSSISFSFYFDLIILSVVFTFQINLLVLFRKMAWTKNVLGSCFRQVPLRISGSGCLCPKLPLNRNCNTNSAECTSKYYSSNISNIFTNVLVMRVKFEERHFCKVSGSSRSSKQIMIDNIGGHHRYDNFCKQSEIYISEESRKPERNRIRADHAKELGDILNIKSTKAYAIVKKHPRLASMDFASLSRNLEDLMGRGMTVERIIAMPWLLALGKEILDEKFNEVQKTLKINTFPCAAPFLEMPLTRQVYIADLWKEEQSSIERTKNKSFKNRIEYLAARLKCENTEVADMMAKVLPVMSTRLPIIEERLKVLLDYKVQPEDIVKDPYVFMFTSTAIEKRLKICQSEGLETVKPWMLRCTPAAFNLYVHRVHQERELRQGHKDISHFLKERLDCPETKAKEIILRVPSVKRASATKLNEMIHFLYSHGFTSAQIIDAPRVLGHSVETIAERIKELATYGYTPPFLNVLCQTSTNYASFIRRLKPAANKSEINYK